MGRKDDVISALPLVGLPWCCVIPIALSGIGVISPGLNKFLMDLTPVFLPISIALLGGANWWVWSGRCKLRRNRIIVTASTILAVFLWIWTFTRMGWI